DAPEVDQHLRLREPQFHGRDETVAARQDLGVLAVFRQQANRFLERPRSLIIKCGGNHDRPPFEIARQIRSGVSGMSRCRMPSGESASITALAIAGVAPMVPASPTPLIPIELLGDGVTVLSMM